ncbi:MAG: nuclear transport factor 2 family protein [Gemmatimonadota bacterium]|nr:nuclear transport factor 2 family protein [Gemmatimonadota bacterium]
MQSLFVFGIVFFASGGISAALPAQGPPARNTECRAGDSAALGRVATGFHRTLSTGDTTGINSLLAPDLRVIEGGTVENRQQYLSGHLSEDIAFAKALKEERAPFTYNCDGNVAWLVSTSTSSGTFSGREINTAGAELLLLSRSRKGWQIRAIHWSSARRQPR